MGRVADYVLGLVEEILGEAAEREKRFSWVLGDPSETTGRCVELPFDAVWASRRLIIEVDEDQHRRPVRFWDKPDVPQAVAATADAYREQLQHILERQDGPDWLDAFNQRRRQSMLDTGKRAPEPYRSFEPRAVINCLAYDPAGLHLIPATDLSKVKQLSGLSVQAHHPDPDQPPTEADAHRAWRLYSEITGQPAPADPFKL